jgi:hypothetical protein
LTREAQVEREGDLAALLALVERNESYGEACAVP